MTERNKPELWEKIKKDITNRETAGTKVGQWSGRKAQMAVREYKKEGGGYLSPRSENNPLIRWTEQKWGTKSGMPSSFTGERYLPLKALNILSDKEYRETTEAKRKSMMKGEQYSKQPKKIAEKTKKYV
jgi:hypothetical protein